MASKKNLSATITIGGAVAGSLGASLRYATNEINAVTSAIKNQTREQFKLGAATKQYEQQSKSAMRAERSRALATSGKGHLASAGVAFGVVGAAAGAMVLPVKAAVDFENAMLGIAKQVAGARDASGKLTPIYHEMAKEIQALGRVIPMATNDLAAMAAAGARMDIPRDQLIAFTKTAAMMAEAFELPAAELADQMGKIKKLFGLGTQKEVSDLADSINYLDDNAISKGGDIIDFLQRAGGSAGSVKITGAQMAALGSTMLTLGETSERAGTSVKALFTFLGSAETMKPKFRAAIAQLGLSLEEVQKGMQVDAQGTLLKVLDKVKALPKDQQIGVLKQIAGLEHAGTLAKLANQTDEYRKQIALANSTAAQGSMAKEFAARLETTGAKAKLLKNELTELGVSIGTQLLPVIKEVLPQIGEAVRNGVEWISTNKDTIITIGKVAAAVLAGSQAFGVMSTALGVAKLAMAGLNTVTKANWIMLGVSALVTGAVLVYENWDKVRGVFTAIGDAISNVWEKTKRFFVGFGGYEALKRYDREQEQKRQSEQAVPPESVMSVAPSPQWSSSNSSSQQTNNINFYQQPGQDSQAAARALVEEIAKRERVKQRSATFDPVGAQ